MSHISEDGGRIFPEVVAILFVVFQRCSVHLPPVRYVVYKGVALAQPDDRGLRLVFLRTQNNASQPNTTLCTSTHLFGIGSTYTVCDNNLCAIAPSKGIGGGEMGALGVRCQLEHL